MEDRSNAMRDDTNELIAAINSPRNSEESAHIRVENDATSTALLSV